MTNLILVALSIFYGAFIFMYLRELWKWYKLYIILKDSNEDQDS